MKKFFNYPALFLLLLLPMSAFAVGKVTTAISNQSPTVVGGADASDNITPLRLNANGNVLTVEAFGTISSTRITISSNGATARTQGATLSVNSCTFQALSANTGVVYAGGSTVTNASGVNPGFPLSAGTGLGPVTMSNLNQIYFSADTANDKVAVFCN